MQNTENSANRIASLAKAGGGLLKLIGILLLVYAVGIAIFGIFHYSATKSKLLTYGMSDATGSLIAWVVMLVAFGLPAFAIFRIVMIRGKPYDYAAAMILPLISWGIAQIPANFDATTGEALRYCAKRPGGELFCLDRPGIDPLTKQPLGPMDAKLAERQYREERGLLPKRIVASVEGIQFFDPLSDPNKPEPKVWVAKNDRGCYDLFDNPGVHPQTGEPLLPVTRDIVRTIVQCVVTAKVAVSGQPSSTSTSTPRASDPPPGPYAGVLRSTEGVRGTSITFINTTQHQVMIFWIDYNGREQFYKTLVPGERYEQPTYVTHPWVVRESSRRTVLLTLVADATPRTAVVAER